MRPYARALVGRLVQDARVKGLDDDLERALFDRPGLQVEAHVARACRLGRTGHAGDAYADLKKAEELNQAEPDPERQEENRSAIYLLRKELEKP